ncbi:hypothetical protein BH11MYX1_BH11MYX1_02390 [soil metagenome]
MQDHTWHVYDGEDLVLDVSSRAGSIRSTAHLPPGTPPTTSSFMSATSYDASHEDQFHTILVASHSVDEFLAGVRAAGLTVKD